MRHMIQEIRPRQSWWERLTSEAMRLSPQVKQALVTLCGTFLLSAIVGVGGCIKTHSENSRLKAEVDRQKGELHSKEVEISKLEIELSPFRNLAVQQFNRADTESMKKLAEAMATLRRDYAANLEALNSQRVEIEQLKLRMAPKSLVERLRACLDNLDPVIVKSGKTGIGGELPTTKIAELEALCKEPGAEKYITLRRIHGKTRMYSDGTWTAEVEISLATDLIKLETDPMVLAP